MSLRRPAGFPGGLLALVAILGWTTGAAGQTVVFRSRGQGMPRADRAVRSVLERGRYRVVARDTVIEAGSVVAGDLIAIRATVHLEGRVAGDVVAVLSDVFTRPGARVDGTVVVLGGGFYGSALAELGAPPIDAAAYAYDVEEREDGTYVIVAPGARPRVRLAGVRGFTAPAYDRVNALTVAVGLEFERGSSVWLPEASVRLRYRTARKDGDGDLELRWAFGRHALALRGGIDVRTNDGWALGDLENSLYAFVAGLDARNYYEGRFGEADLRLNFGTATRWRTRLRAGWERARSLDGRDPFSVFSARGGFQPNLAVEPTDAATVAVTLGLARPGRRASLDAELGVEAAEEAVAGDLSFVVLRGAADLLVPLAGGAQLLFGVRGQRPGGAGAPPQRWRALGGWGTLPTLRPVERAGDVMWWLSVTYWRPLGPGQGVLDRLVFWGQYAAGNAWIDGKSRPPTVHDLGVGLTLGPLSIGVFTDPADEFRTALGVGFDPRPRAARILSNTSF